jgi:hypothetical protein
MCTWLWTWFLRDILMFVLPPAEQEKKIKGVKLNKLF